MGAHSSKDPEDPLAVGSPWWQRQHPPDDAPTDRYRLPPEDERTRFLDQALPPAGLPEDRYEEWASGEMRRLEGFAARPVSPPIRTEGFPTQERPRAPRPVGAAQVPTGPRPQPAPEPAEPPSLLARVTHSAREWFPDACFALLAVIVLAVVAGWGIDLDRKVDALQVENANLRAVQEAQQKRLGEAEETVKAAHEKATSAQDEQDLLQQRLAQLEEDENQSGS